MPIAYRDAATAANGASPTSLGVARPADVVDGDLMLAFLAISADRTVTGEPAGWAQMAHLNTGTASGDCRLYVYQKVAAGESGTYVWSFSGGADAAGVIVAYSGVGAAPVQTTASALMASSTTSHTLPSVTPTTSSTWTVFGLGVNPGYDGNTTFTTPSGLTARAEADPGAGTTNRAVVKVWDAANAGATATGAKTTTLNNHAKGVGYSVVVAPSGALEQHIVLESRAVA